MIIASIFEDEIKIDPNMVVFKYMSILGSMGYYDTETEEALGLITGGKVNRDILINNRFSLDEAAEAFAVQGKSEESVKVLIVD